MIIKDLDKIQQLLDKYFEAETSLAEEKILADYFQQPHIAPQFKPYQPLFRAFAAERQTVWPVARKRFLWVRWAAAAAVVGAMALGTQQWVSPQGGTATALANQPKKARVIVLDENSDPEKALEEVEKALALVSKKMQKGEEKASQGLSAVKKVTRYVPTTH